MKIESSLKQTYGGVYFFSKPMNPNEIDELDQNEWNEFLDAVRAMGKFHCIVIDLPCANEDTAKKLCHCLTVFYLLQMEVTQQRKKHRHL